MSAIDWTPELVERICGEIASGRAVSDVSREDWCPAEKSIYRQMAADKNFADAINRARAAQQEREVEECVRMADMATTEDWQVVKLRIWARQWRASKLAPKKYGDKLALAGDSDNPIAVQRIERVLIKPGQ